MQTYELILLLAVAAFYYFGWRSRQARQELLARDSDTGSRFTEFGIPTAPIRERNAFVADQSSATIRSEARRIAPAISRVLKDVGDALRPGMTTREVHDLVLVGLRGAGFEPAMAGYNGYPAAAAISVNEQLLHAIPSDRPLRVGDVVTIETGGVTGHAFASQGWTFAVGEVDKQTQKLLHVSRQALAYGIQAARPRARVGDIGSAIQTCVEEAGFAVVRDYIGYGMGKERIQAPAVPGFGEPGAGARLKSGQILHLHVIAKIGGFQVELADDGWTVTGADRSPGVLFSAMVLIDKTGPVVLSSLMDGTERA